jgi:uncharacterized protein (DUF1684 family)
LTPVPRRSTLRRPARLLPALALPAILALASCSPAPSDTASDAPLPEGYAEEIETWQARRSEGLRSEDGWLSLVGLHWLEEGENTFGSGEDNDLVFPEGTPERIGTVTLADGEVTLRAEEGTGLAIAPPATEEGEESPESDRAPVEPVEPGEEIVMAPDVTGDPTVLELGSLSLYAIERGGRYGLRVKDPEGPARTNFQGLDFYDTDPAWRVEALLERRDGMTVAIPNVLGQVEDVRAPGVLVFRSPGGEELRITPMQEAEGDDLFLVFGDGTNGHGTYGGGRFLYADPPEAGSDVVIVDFNRSYNPPCAFTPYATCPLPPPENKLGVAVEAGEKSYAGEIPH